MEAEAAAAAVVAEEAAAVVEEGAEVAEGREAKTNITSTL